MRFIALMAAMLLLAASPQKGPGIKEQRGPIHITSDRMEADYGKRIITFSGDVVAKRGEFTLQSRVLKVFLEKEGEGIERLVAEGEVHIDQGERRAVCSKATYYYKEGKVVLEGHPMVWQGDDRLRGWRIIFFVNEDKAIAEGKGEERVRLIIVSTERRREE